MFKYYLRVFFWSLFCVALFILMSIFRLNNNVVPDDYPRSDWVNIVSIDKLGAISLLTGFYSSESWLRLVDANENNLNQWGGLESVARNAVAANLTDFRATAKIVQLLEAKGKTGESQQLAGLMLKQWPSRFYRLAVARLNEESDEHLQRKIQQVNNLLAAEEKRILRELDQDDTTKIEKEKEINDIKNQIEEARQQRVNQLKADDMHLRGQILLALQKKIFGN